MASSPSPQFYVTRQNGAHVPMVAVDELPPSFNIQNVPRQLHPHELQGMTPVGTVDTTHQKYVVNGPKNPFLLDNSLMASMFAPVESSFAPIGSPTSNMPGISAVPHMGLRAPIEFEGPSGQNTIEPKAALSRDPVTYNKHRIAELTAGPSGQIKRPDPNEVTPGRKKYCSYWLRHGECDYAQQGCLYKHEMPLDLEVLQTLGLKDIPRWYREEYGLASLLAGEVNHGIEDTSRPPAIMASSWRDRSTATTAAQHRSHTPDLTRGMQQLQLRSVPTPRQPASIRRLPEPPRGNTKQNTSSSSAYASPYPTAPRGPSAAPLPWRRAKTNLWDDPVSPSSSSSSIAAAPTVAGASSSSSPGPSPVHNIMDEPLIPGLIDSPNTTRNSRHHSHHHHNHRTTPIKAPTITTLPSSPASTTSSLSPATSSPTHPSSNKTLADSMHAPPNRLKSAPGPSTGKSSSSTTTAAAAGAASRAAATGSIIAGPSTRPTGKTSQRGRRARKRAAKAAAEAARMEMVRNNGNH